MMKQNRFYRLWPVIIVLLLIAGCATVGNNFPSSAVEKIVIDKTTRAEILSMLGEPWRTGIENGQKTWAYGYYHYSIPAETKDRVITFNDDNTVDAYTFNTTQ